MSFSPLGPWSIFTFFETDLTVPWVDSPGADLGEISLQTKSVSLSYVPMMKTQYFIPETGPSTED